MSKTSIIFDYPYLLPIALILIGIGFIPHLKLNKQKRRNRNRITSIVLHSIIVFLITLVLSGFSFNVENAIRKSDVVFLIDVSDSNISAKDKMDKYLEEQIEYLDKDSMVAFVTYGNGKMAASNFTNNASKAYKSYLSRNINIDTSATNLEEAIKFSEKVLNNSANKRIVILSDGLETDGNAINYINNNKDEKLTIDAIIFDNQTLENDLQISNVSFSSEPIINKASSVIVSIDSNQECKASISIYDNDRMISKDYRTVNVGTNNFKYYITLNAYGMHDIHFNVSADNDTNLVNNDYHHAINLQNDKKILLVDGTGNDTTKLSSLLSQYYDVKVVNYDKVDSVVDSINKYGEVIMANVNNNTISDNFVNVLNDYTLNGGGLLFTGGDNTFHYGNFERSKLEKMMPCWTDLEEDPVVAILFIIDKSSSMRETIPGSSKTRLELAKESTINAISCLNPSDYVGVIAFDASASVVVPLTLASKQAEIENKIKSIESGMGTAFLQSFTNANNLLVGFDAVQYKHIIFISDGNPTDSGYQEKVSSIREKGITTSTIGLGTNINVDMLKSLANAGGGNCYSVNYATQLDEIMVSETEFSRVHYTNEYSSLVPTIKTHNQVVEGISTLPSLKGFYGVELKPKATSILEYNNNSIYSTIQYGQGNVGCFTSDLSGHYSSSYFTDSRGQQFILNAIDNLYSYDNNVSDVSCSITSNNYKATVVISSNEQIKDSSIAVEITTPKLETIRYKANLVNNSYVFEANNFYHDSGLYVLNLSINGKEYEFGSSFAYSKEYDSFISKSKAKERLNDLCVSTGGKLYSLDDLLFNNESLYYDYEYDPKMILVSIALALFVLDIAVRKFKFKWLHEIFRKNKQEQ